MSFWDSDTATKPKGFFADVFEKRAKEEHGEAFAELGLTPGLLGNNSNSTSPVPTGPGTVDLARGFGQGMARGYAASGQFMAKQFGLASGDEVDPNEYFGRGETAGKVGRAVFGTDQKFTATSEDEELLDMIGLEGGSATSGGRLTVLLAGLDLFTGGTIKGLKGAVTVLKNADNVEDAFKVMKNIGFDDDIAKDYAEIFAKTKDKKTIVKGLESAMELQNTTKRVTNSPLRVADGSEPLTVGGKLFSDEVQTLRTATTRLFDDVPLEKMTSELTQIRTMLKRNETPSLDDFGRAISVLEDAGVKTDSIRASFDDLSATVKTEPWRFVPEIHQKTGSIPVKEYVAPPEVRIKSGDIPVRYVEGGGYVPIKDARYTKSGDIFVEGVRHEPVREIPIKDARTRTIKGVESEEPFKVSMTKEGGNYPKTGDIFVKGVRYEPAREIPIKDARYQTKGEIPVRESFEEAIPFADDAVDASKPKLDEVADPLREDYGRIVSDIQTRYGKEKVTKNQIEKFKKNEQDVYMQIFRYAEEFEYVAMNGGAMVQSMPKWVPTHLRDATLLGELSQMVGRGEVPTVHGSPHMELYLAVVDEVARRSGIKHMGPKPSLDPVGAVLQAHKDRTAKIGEPIVHEESVTLRETPDKSKRFWPPAKDRTWTKELKLEAGAVKDKREISNDIFRLSEDVFGEQWGVVKEKVFDKFDSAKGRMVDEMRVFSTKLEEDILKGLGIQRKSKESAAVMDLGEGVRTYDQIVKEFGETRAKDIEKATVWFRAQYDQMIDTINAIRPDGYKITKRADYFRHFEELGANGALKKAFEDPGLSNLGGESFLTVVKKSFTKTREGTTSTRDAVGGFIDYISQYAYEKHLSPEIGRVNAFIDDLEKLSGKGSPLEWYISRLKNWSDELNGLTNHLDSFWGEYGSVLNVGNWFNNQAKRNAVLFNIGSTIIQYANLPDGVAWAKRFIFNGAKRSIVEMSGKTEPMWKQSTFIKERYVGDVFDAFKVGAIEKTLKNGGKMISIIDEISTKLIWNSMYEKALAEGVANPIKYADDVTRKSVGGRGIGEVSLLQKSKTFQILAPFTLEQFKTLYNLRDFVKAKDVSALMYYAVTAWVLSGAYRWVTGRDGMFNPIEALQDSYDIMQGEEETKDKVKHVAGRVSGEVLNAIPLGNYVVNLAAFGMGMTEKEREALFSEQGDPVKYGSTPLLWNAIRPLGDTVNFWSEELPTEDERVKGVIDTLLAIGLPAGGKQIKNAIQGTRHLAEENPDPMIEPGVPGALRNVLFGKWSPNIKYEDDLVEEMRELYKDNAELVAAGKQDEAKENLKILTEQTAPFYEKVRHEERAKEGRRLMDATRPLVRTLDALVKAGKKDEALNILKSLDEQDLKLVGAIRAEAKSEGYKRDQLAEADPESFIRESIDFAYAFGTNPVQAWNLLMSGSTIETTVGGSFGGMVTARRMPKEDTDGFFFNKEGSNTVKKELVEATGVKATDANMAKYKLEHKLPLSLGGSNQRENLELVSTEDHDSWTGMEVYLGQAVKRQKIDYVTAQELILRFKGYEGEPISEAEIKAIVGVDSFPAYNDPSRDEGIHRGLDDIGRNTFLLSDEDYAQRNAEDGYSQGKRTIGHVIRDIRDGE